MSPGAYLGLALHTSFADVTQRFGRPLGQADLTTFLAGTSLSSLVQSQPAGACAYYLNAANRSQRAYALCFNRSGDLVQTQVVTSSSD